MKGDFHVRFRENVRVKFPCVTRLPATLKNDTANIKRKIKREYVS